MQDFFSKYSHVTENSQNILKNSIFVAISGSAHDGHNYIEDAIKRGAAVIIHEHDVEPKENIIYLKVDNSRKVLSEISSLIYEPQPSEIVGVTGTSGKSSVVHFFREIIQLLGEKAVSIGTLGIIGDYNFSSNLTSPSSSFLHYHLQQIALNDIKHVALECSSHGLEQHRLDHIKFKACAFTNFSRDHLDYHQNMDEYFDAKIKLFTNWANGLVVLNRDIEQFRTLEEICLKFDHQILTYGLAKHENNISFDIINFSDGVYQVKWRANNDYFITNLNFFGDFQISNLACAIGLARSVGFEYQEIFAILNKIRQVPGRMELIALYNQAMIMVDYAHKPDALLQALQNIRIKTKGKVWLLFGCGGNRDRGKRKLMGEIATENADFSIITDDNPRYEDPSLIRKDIISGFNQANYIEIADRREAINYGLQQISPGDTLLVTGKGHEELQIIGNQEIKFSDKEEILTLLTKN